MSKEAAKKLGRVVLLSFLVCPALSQVNASTPAHEAAVVRLGKAMQIEEALSRGVEVGLARQLINHPNVVSTSLDCIKLNEMKQLLRTEWVRIYKRHLSEEEATAISEYLESPGGIKLVIGTRACWAGPQVPDQCNPVAILNDMERTALAAFEESSANASLKRAQPVAQKELKGFSSELVLKESERCVQLGR